MLKEYCGNQGQGVELGPCVSVTVSGFQVILQKWTDFCENEKTNISVHCLVSAMVPTGVIFGIFENSGIFLDRGFELEFRENFRKVSRNFWTFETTVLFRSSFDRQKFLTFGYRELSKVKNFWQTHGLSIYRVHLNVDNFYSAIRFVLFSWRSAT